MENAITLCLIGCGGHAHRVYADSIVRYNQSRGGLRLAACCDTDGEKAASFREKAGFARCYTHSGQMLDQEKPDAVILVTPFQYTAEIAVNVIGRGCAVMMEKPPGKDTEECMAIAEAVKRKNAVNMVAFNRRNAPIVKKAAELLHDNNSAALRHIDYQMYRCGRGEPHFHTTAIHGVDMIGYIARSAYQSLDIAYAPLAGAEGAANMFLRGRFENGITTQQSYCPMSGLVMERITIAADNAALYVETPIWHGPDFPGVIRLYRNNALELEISGEALSGPELFETDGFYGQLSEFLECVRHGRKTPNDIFSAIDSVRISDCLAARKLKYIHS